MCKTALEYASDVNNVEFVTYRDSDDTTSYAYTGNHKEVIMPRTTQIFQMWNECQKLSTGPIYMFMADDFIFTSKDWDLEVLDTFDKIEDKIALLAVNNGENWFKYGFSGLGFVHKNWVDAIGYLFPNYFYPNNADKWVNDLSEMIGRRIKLNMTCECTMENIRDNVHCNKSRYSSPWRKMYYQDFAVKQREEDANKLRAAMSIKWGRCAVI
jgi:hypothetical protein